MPWAKIEIKSERVDPIDYLMDRVHEILRGEPSVEITIEVRRDYMPDC